MNRWSRRDLFRLSATGAFVMPFVVDSARSAAAAPTAREIVERIKRAVGVEWNSDTVDTFKAGDPSTVVTGVATTALATLDVLRQSAKAGANLVITSGPTFYSKGDGAAPSGQGALPSDAVFVAKNELIKTSNLVVWRFSEHWQRRTPNPFARGLIEAVGWPTPQQRDDPTRVTIPAMTLDALVSTVKTKLNARGGMRVVGDPHSRIATIGVLPGSTSIQAALTLLPHVDAIIAGEVREWESVEYARDMMTAGRKKALILLGRTLSENPGMKVCAQWLEAIAPEVPCRWMPVGDPYWRPAT